MQTTELVMEGHMAVDLRFGQNASAYVGLMVGVTSLLIAVFHFWAGPFEPQPRVERSIAKMMVNISKEVLHVKRGDPEVTQARTWNIDDKLRIGSALLRALALVLGAIGFIRREDNRIVAMGSSLGASAIAFQFIAWFALVAAGLVLFWILLNLGSG